MTRHERNIRKNAPPGEHDATTPDLESYFARIKQALDKQHKSHEQQIAGIIEEGKVLSELKETFKPWMPVKQKLCAEFKYYADKIEDLQAIAEHPVLSDSGNYLKLPTSIACLRALADIADHERVQQLITERKINPDMTIAQADELKEHPVNKLIRQTLALMAKYPEPPPVKGWKIVDESLPKIIEWYRGIDAKFAAYLEAINVAPKIK